jgi:hypothetical protein
MTVQRRTLLLATIVPIQVFLARRAWLDLARRTDSEVRGSKNLWRVVVSGNPGNAWIYLLFGRRRVAS